MTAGAFLTEVLPGALTSPGERLALIEPESGLRLSYSSLGTRVAELAGRLRSAGIERGDRVALALPPGPELIELLFAVASLGAAAAPLNPAYVETEFSFYLGDLHPRLLLLPDGELQAARRAAHGSTDVVDVESQADGPAVLRVGGRELATAAVDVAPEPDDVALLLHTSGTTARPKQVPLRHRNLMASAGSIARHYRLSPDDVSCCVMPLFHIHGLVASALAQLLAGGTIAVSRRVAPSRFWQQVVDHGVTWYSASPTYLQSLLERAPATPAPSTRLRFVRSCSSSLRPALQDQLEARLDVPVLQAYGMTEASHEMAANPMPPASRMPGSVGMPTGAEVHVVKPGGGSLAEGEIGEVVVRGPGVMSGYLGSEHLNAEAFYGEWFRTGDEGVFENGYLWLVGRIKEIVNRGGEKVSPLEVEDVLLAHSAVAEAVVYAIPDEKYGQVVGSAVVLNADVHADDLLAYCRERLAAFKVPTLVHVVDRLPRTATGKLQRPRMAAHFGDG